MRADILKSLHENQIKDSVDKLAEMSSDCVSRQEILAKIEKLHDQILDVLSQENPSQAELSALEFDLDQLQKQIHITK